MGGGGQGSREWDELEMEGDVALMKEYRTKQLEEGGGGGAGGEYRLSMVQERAWAVRLIQGIRMRQGEG